MVGKVGPLFFFRHLLTQLLETKCCSIQLVIKTFWRKKRREQMAFGFRTGQLINQINQIHALLAHDTSLSVPQPFLEAQPSVPCLLPAIPLPGGQSTTRFALGQDPCPLMRQIKANQSHNAGRFLCPIVLVVISNIADSNN